MMNVNRFEFADRPTVAPAVCERSAKPICMACEAGHHEQPMLDHESCDCACHGIPLDRANYKVAA
jgi:hypothetical protein